MVCQSLYMIKDLKEQKCYEKLAKEFLKINDSEQKAKHMKE